MSSFFKIVISLGITFGLSTLVALFFENKFWLVWSAVTVIQFLGFYLYNQIYSNRIIKDLEALKIDQIKEANRNLVNVSCPCDENNEQTIDFRFDQNNTYVCNKCNKTVSCKINIKSILVTEPIYFDDNKK